MAVLPIRKYGDPILRQKTTPQNTFDEKLREQAEAMIDTMQAESGIGLAANQAGFTNALCVVDIGLIKDGAKPQAFVNPLILEESGELTAMEEGCLSIPDVSDNVQRRERIKLKFQDLEGAEHVQEFNSTFARVLQHEVDHLSGIFFIDRLSPLRRRMHNKKLKELADQTLAELRKMK